MTGTVQWARNPKRGRAHAVTAGLWGPGSVAMCGQRLDVSEDAGNSPDRCQRCVRVTSAT